MFLMRSSALMASSRASSGELERELVAKLLRVEARLVEQHPSLFHEPHRLLVPHAALDHEIAEPREAFARLLGHPDMVLLGLPVRPRERDGVPGFFPRLHP